KRLANPTVNRRLTAWPKGPVEMGQVGVRFDYDGKVVKDGVTCHQYNMQPNAGKVSSSTVRWREANGGTHAVMTEVLIKENTSQEEEVKEAVDEAGNAVEEV
ncbi:uncharacterized protein BDZ99DRAFT_395049, partial [Mytilinidion resinicola]